MNQLSSRYKRPILECVATQVLLLLICSTLTDMGMVGTIAIYAIIAFWIGTLVLVLRRPLSPTRTDLTAIRFGTLPLFIIALIITAIIWKQRQFLL